ncbi:hypothetical protein [Vibrio sp. SCSIO 43136]|uniref:hypothetical protein n=1 Tax=Vibrio sp. SCSIO 43136 TaxID=2819101 RepID=UPI002075CDA7|nr:hypothetical protein [Vibrio sp. SCSIO 43136]USD67883.1 hypothetical protein J4N39_17005 [Vibrio sp. SCSIO 43136]
MMAIKGVIAFWLLMIGVLTLISGLSLLAVVTQHSDLDAIQTLSMDMWILVNTTSDEHTPLSFPSFIELDTNQAIRLIAVGIAECIVGASLAKTEKDEGGDMEA